MEAINFVKEFHKPFIGVIDYDIVDEEGHNYEYYVEKYNEETQMICKSLRCKFDDLPMIEKYEVPFYTNHIPTIMKNLKTLIIHSTHITSIPKTFTNLETLHINRNSSIEIPETFTKLRNLTAPRGAKLCDKFVNLEYLDVENCDNIPETYVNLKYLKVNFSSVSLSDKFVKLEHLDFIHSELIDELPSTYINLTYLNVSYSNIEHLPKTYAYLDYLNIHNTNIEEIPKEYQQLRILHVSEHIKEIPDEIKFLTNIYVDYEYPNENIKYNGEFCKSKVKRFRDYANDNHIREAIEHYPRQF